MYAAYHLKADELNTDVIQTLKNAFHKREIVNTQEAMVCRDDFLKAITEPGAKGMHPQCTCFLRMVPGTFSE
jgi:hypothetical protein